jgi:hypothetical protein
MGEEQYYEIVRKWLERQGYYCGGNIEVRGKPNLYQDIGPRHRRADVAGVKNVGSQFADLIEIVAVEVRDKSAISDKDISDTANYSQYAHKCYLATTALHSEKHKQIAEQRNIGLLRLQPGKKDPIALHNPTPANPKSPAETMEFLRSLQIVQCSICGSFFERYVRSKDRYHSYFQIIRARYFKVINETDKNPLDLKDIKQLKSEYQIRRQICGPCIQELFLEPGRIERIRRVQEKEKSFHARWDKDENAFECLVGKKKDCTEYVYTPEDIVMHLRDTHDIDPDDQIIKGWTDKHERIWRKHLARKKK